MQKSSIYQELEARWRRGEPTVMDGGIGSELQAMGYPQAVPVRGRNYTWGTMALYDAPEVVQAMHRRYVDAGADILLTNTFLFHRCVRLEHDGDLAVPAGTWHEKARLAVRRRIHHDDPGQSKVGMGGQWGVSERQGDRGVG